MDIVHFLSGVVYLNGIYEHWALIPHHTPILLNLDWGVPWWHPINCFKCLPLLGPCFWLKFSDLALENPEISSSFLSGAWYASMYLCSYLMYASLVTYHSLMTLPALGRYASGFVNCRKWCSTWISFRDVFSVCVASCRWQWGGGVDEVRLYDCLN